jgi:Transglycosylase-like domain
VLVNPGIQEWFDNLQGRSRGGGGARPPPGRNDALAAALAGIVRPEIAGSFQAPAINAARFTPRPPEPNPRLPEPSPQQVPFQGISGGGRDRGGGAIAAGLGKLGQGIEGALGDWAAKRKAQQEAIANANTLPGSSPVFGSPSASASPKSGAPASNPYTPAPIGSASDTPIFTGQDSQAEPRAPVPPIGAFPGSLPTFAQGVAGTMTKTAGGPSSSYLPRLAQIENPSGNPYETSPTGATGKYQFIPSTWRQYGAGGDIHSNADQDAAMARFTQANYAALQNGLGRPPTDGELYLAHQQGAAGAINLIQHPNAPAGSIVSPQNIRVNGGDPNAPASQFVQKWTSKFPDQPPPTQTGAAAYAAMPPQLGVAGPTAPQVGQDVIPGQTDPHKPGFDPSAVPFHRTPEMDQGGGASGVPIPPPPQAPLINGGQPGVYSMPDQQGMNQQPQIDPLAAALAGQGTQSSIDPNNPAMAPGIVDALNMQPDPMSWLGGDFGGFPFG